MKEKNKKEFRSSLYIYISVSFLIILVVVMLSTVVYFGFIHNYIAEIYGTNIPVKDLIDQSSIDEATINKITSGLRHASIYGTLVGIALIIVVAGKIIKPIRSITEATKKVASGDFSVKVNTKRKDEIGNLADNFNIMVDELNSIDYLRRDFISNISHELKTPIASIQGFTKLLADDNISKEEKDEYINIILEETTRLSNLSSNMIKLSKFENQEIVTNQKEYKLDEQLRKAIIMLEKKLNQKNIEVTLNAEPITIMQDEDLIMEIWINLLNNAVKFTKENGKIEIGVKEKDDYIMVEIKDDGIGIPKEKQARIFEKFYQVEKSHSLDGSGLGLAIVKRIIDLVEGKIDIESEEGKGTTFKVFLKSNKNTL